VANTLKLHRNGAAEPRVLGFTLVGFIDWLGLLDRAIHVIFRREAKRPHFIFCRVPELGESSLATMGTAMIFRTSHAKPRAARRLSQIQRIGKHGADFSADQRNMSATRTRDEGKCTFPITKARTALVPEFER
jgi:hypothetical protein